MRFSAAFTVSVLSACILVSAVPPQTSNAGRAKMMCKTGRHDAEGAVYFITNEPQENMIIAATINADGTLNLDRAVATGGRGLHGVAASLGPDGLFSQGSIKASSKGKVLATVNPGSDTVSLFSIDPKLPANLTPLGDPVSSEGEFPMSLTFNDAGDRLCVLNGGAVANVNCYHVDKRLGLTAISNTLRTFSLNQTTPPSGPPNTASHIVFNHDENQLIVSVKGAPPTAVGYLAIWDIGSDGSLSPDFQHVAPPSGGALPFSLTAVPGKNAFLATDPALGFTVFDLSGQNRSSAVPISGQGATCWSSFSAKTGNFYLTDVGTSTVTEVHIDAASLQASIVKQYPQMATSGTIDNDVATVNGKDFLYVLAANATSVDVLALSGAGKATKVSTLDISGAARAAGVTIDRNNLQGMTHFIRQ